MYDKAVADVALFEVVLNDEEQYSIWPAHKEIPLGWKKIGQQASKEACLGYIKEVWTDMRPLSLRMKTAAMEAGQ